MGAFSDRGRKRLAKVTLQITERWVLAQAPSHFPLFRSGWKKASKRQTKAFKMGTRAPKQWSASLHKVTFGYACQSFVSVDVFHKKTGKRLTITKHWQAWSKRITGLSGKYYFGFLQNFFPKLGMRSLCAMAPRGAEITTNHKKHILEKDSGPPLAFEVRFWSGFGIKKELKSLKVLQNGAKKEPK